MSSVRRAMRTLGLVWLLLARQSPGEEFSPPEAEARAASGSGANESSAPGETTQPRARWGVGGFGGPFFPSSPLCFPLGGVEIRAGGQVGPGLAVLGTAVLALGGGTWDGVVKTAAWTGVGLLAEVSLSERLFIAAGPGVALGLWLPFTGGEILLPGEVSAGGFFFTADLRLGVALGGRAGPTGQRRHATLGVDLLILVGRGSESVYSATWRPTPRPVTAVGFIPALTLGYDVR